MVMILPVRSRGGGRRTRATGATPRGSLGVRWRACAERVQHAEVARRESVGQRAPRFAMTCAVHGPMPAGRGGSRSAASGISSWPEVHCALRDRRGRARRWCAARAAGMPIAWTRATQRRQRPAARGTRG